MTFKQSKPNHPQTCGKAERFHQTEKKFLARQDPARTLAQLQTQLDRFVTYYNIVRPHRSLGRKTPLEVYEAKVKAHPISAGNDTHCRIRHDRVYWRGETVMARTGGGPETMGSTRETSTSRVPPSFPSRVNPMRLRIH